MKQSVFKTLLAVEATICFALPAYFLFWGVLTLPLWLRGWQVTYALIHLLCTIGGLMGMAAVIRVMYYVLSSVSRPINWYIIGPLLLVGILATWTEMTGQFAGFSLNPFWLFIVGAPTICTAHVVWLAMRKKAGAEPNKLLQATCEDARA